MQLIGGVLRVKAVYRTEMFSATVLSDVSIMSPELSCLPVKLTEKGTKAHLCNDILTFWYDNYPWKHWLN